MSGNPQRRQNASRISGEAKEVVFKYERLGSFCYLCGFLGHVEALCDRLFTMANDDGRRAWGPQLRDEHGRATSDGGARWLREEIKGSWSAPNQEDICSKNLGNHSATDPKDKGKSIARYEED